MRRFEVRSFSLLLCFFPSFLSFLSLHSPSRITVAVRPRSWEQSPPTSALPPPPPFRIRRSLRERSYVLSVVLLFTSHHNTGVIAAIFSRALIPTVHLSRSQGLGARLNAGYLYPLAAVRCESSAREMEEISRPCPKSSRLISPNLYAGSKITVPGVSAGPRAGELITNRQVVRAKRRRKWLPAEEIHHKRSAGTDTPVHHDPSSPHLHPWRPGEYSSVSPWCRFDGELWPVQAIGTKIS